MLTAIIGGLLGAMIYQVIKQMFFKPKPLPKYVPPKAIPVARVCVCKHGSHVHKGDGTGECGVHLRTEGKQNFTCACKRFTFPEDY